MDSLDVAARPAAKLTVLNPVGFPPKITKKQQAPRLEALDGKIVYLVDCRFDDADVFMGEVRSWFAEHMPGVETRIIALNNYYGKDDPETWKVIQAKGDAAIVGVGH